MEDLQQLFDSFSSLKVGIIGDVMLDTYMWGKVDRISPEAPVPVVTLTKTDTKIGGAGNVAVNVQSLGAQAFIISVTGNDENGDKLKQHFKQQNINDKYSLQSKTRKTTNKIRVIGRNQQMMRIDDESLTDLDVEEQEKLIESVRKFIEKEKPQVIILEDYNKGVLTEKVISDVIALCKKANVITAVDPKKKNFFQYKGVDIFKPNLKEVKEAFNFYFEEVSPYTLSKIHQQLFQELGHKISLITLSADGVFYEAGEGPHIISSHVRKIADVTGAGDTVIAVAALVYAVRKNVHLMSDIANTAGGLVCEAVGTMAINKESLLHEYALLHE